MIAAFLIFKFEDDSKYREQANGRKHQLYHSLDILIGRSLSRKCVWRSECCYFEVIRNTSRDNNLSIDKYAAHNKDISYSFEDIPFHMVFDGHDKEDYYIS